MGWATSYIARLQKGETVEFRPRGNSMQGKIESGQLCTVEPIKGGEIRVGDIVLCKVNGQQSLHLVKAVQGGPLPDREQPGADQRVGLGQRNLWPLREDRVASLSR